MGVGVMAKQDPLASYQGSIYHCCAPTNTSQWYTLLPPIRIGVLIDAPDVQWLQTGMRSRGEEIKVKSFASNVHYFLDGRYSHSYRLPQKGLEDIYPALLFYDSGATFTSVPALTRPQLPQSLNFFVN